MHPTFLKSATWRYILIFCTCLFFFARPQAKAQKLKYEEVHAVLEKNDKELSKKYLQEFINQSPKHALAMYRLGKILELELREMDLFEQVDFERKYKTALNLFQVAEVLATKREASKNKAYYQELFGTKKVSASVLKFTYQQQVSRFKSFYDTAQNIISKTELIKHYYRQQESDFDTLIEHFDHFPDIYFSTNDFLIKILNEMVSRADNIRVNIDQMNTLLQRHFPQSRYKQYRFEQFEDFNAQKKSDASFKNNIVNLYDYGQWAGKIVQFIRKEIFPLRKNILEADARLTAIINSYYMDNAVLSHLDYYDASPLIFKLFQLDGNSLAAKVLMYKKLKADYLSRIMENEFDFTQDSGKVVKNVIESSREVLRNIKVTDKGYDNYRGYFNRVFESKDGLQNYLQREEIFWDSEFQSLKAGAIAGKGKNSLYDGFDETSTASNLGGMSKITNAKINLDINLVNQDSLVAFGGFAVQKTIPIGEEKWMAMGLAPSEFSGKKDVFVAKVDQQENVYWLRKFMHLQEGRPFDLSIEDVVINDQKQVFMLLKGKLTKQTIYRLVGLNAKGSLMLDQEIEIESVPRDIIYLEEVDRLLMVLKGRQHSDSADQFEQCHFIEINLAGLETSNINLGIKGTYSSSTRVGQSYIVVFNFLTYQTDDNQFVNSKAIVKGGFNPLVVHFNSNGQLVEIIPSFSEEPIYVYETLVTEQGRVLLKGKKGVHAMDDSTLKNGDDWEQEIKLQDKL